MIDKSDIDKPDFGSAIGSAAVTVKRADLKRAAGIASLFIATKKKTLPALKCAKLDALENEDGPQLALMATDLDKAVVCSVPLVRGKEFQTVVPAKPLLALARNMAGDSLYMDSMYMPDLKLMQVCNADSRKNMLELRAVEVDDFPCLDHRLENMAKAMTLSVKIEAVEFARSMLWAIAHAAKPDDGRQILETVCFRLEHGCRMNYLRVNGCDTHRLMHYFMPTHEHGIVPAQGPQEYLLPADTAKAILKALKLAPTDFVTMQASRDTAVFSWQDAQVKVQVIAPLTMGNKVGTNTYTGHYPDTDKVLFPVRNNTPNYRICFDRKAMLEIVKAGQAMVRGNEILTIIVQDGAATLYFGQANLIDGTRCKMVLPDVLTYMPDGNQRFVVSFNPLYVKDMLECVTTEQVMWMQQDDDKLALFYDKRSTPTQLPVCQDHQPMFVVMPKTVSLNQSMW